MPMMVLDGDALVAAKLGQRLRNRNVRIRCVS